MSNKEKLFMDATKIKSLLEATAIGLAHRQVYQRGNIAKKVELLTGNFIYLRELLTIHHAQYPGDFNREMNKPFFKDFQKRVKNQYVFDKVQDKVKELVENMETHKEQETDVFKVYQYVLASDVVAKIIDKEEFQPIPFDLDKYLEKIFNSLKESFRLSARKVDSFLANPDKYLKSRHDQFVAIHYMTVAAHMNDESAKEFMFALKSIDLDNISTDEVTNKIMFKLNGDSTFRKAICIQRIEELNKVLDDVMLAGLSFSDVVKSVIQSVEYCRKNIIKTYLTVTNVIINNLIVAAYKDSSILKSKEYDLNMLIAAIESDNSSTAEMMRSISGYVIDNYENRHMRVCAHNINTAMKQALGHMAKSEADMFTLNV